jgi:hypothetical protein
MKSEERIIIRPLLSQNLQHLLRRTREHGLLSFHNDRSLHQRGMLQQQVNHGLARDIFTGIKAKGLEIFVLPHELSGRVRKQGQESFKSCSIQWGLQIFDNVELDAARSQNIERSTRLPSTRIVIHRQSFHVSPPQRGMATLYRGCATSTSPRERIPFLAFRGPKSSPTESLRERRRFRGSSALKFSRARVDKEPERTAHDSCLSLTRKKS